MIKRNHKKQSVKVRSLLDQRVLMVKKTGLIIDKEEDLYKVVSLLGNIKKTQSIPVNDQTQIKLLLEQIQQTQESGKRVIIKPRAKAEGVWPPFDKLHLKTDIKIKIIKKRKR